MKSIFDPHFQLLHKAMDLRSERNTVLAGNVANAETPGYKAKDLVFEKELASAMDARRPGQLRVTDPDHFDGRRDVQLAEVQGSVIRSANPVGNADGNSVDLEKEMAKLGENQIAYQALSRMISHKVSVLRHAISEQGVQ